MAKRRRKLKKGIKIFFYLIIIFIIVLFVITNFKKDKQNTESTPQTTANKKINLTLIGDIMFEQPYLTSLNKGDDVNNYLKIVKEEYFNKDDITVGNLETTITDGSLELSGENYTFCSPQKIGKMLGESSIEVLGTTNNHSADRGINGITSTLNYLYDNTSIMPVGSFRTKEERNDLKIVEKKGIKVGFIAYAMGTNKYVAPEERWRLGLFRDMSLNPFQITDEYLNIMKEEITELRKNCDVLVAIMHWGQEYQFNERDDQRQLATFLNELNVDIVLGSHSHCLQPVKWYTNKDGYKTLVFFSMGNFTSADEELEGISTDFDNAYQVGLLANLDVELSNDNKVEIKNIKTEPVINYFDKDERNYQIIPYSKYNSDFENKHYRYELGLNKEFINRIYNKVIEEQFR